MGIKFRFLSNKNIKKPFAGFLILFLFSANRSTAFFFYWVRPCRAEYIDLLAVNLITHKDSISEGIKTGVYQQHDLLYRSPEMG